MVATTPNRGQKEASNVCQLLRARNALIWIVTKEEARVEGFIAEAAATAKYETRTWDIAQGVAGIDGVKDKRFQDTDPNSTLTTMRTLIEAKGGDVKRGVWIMRDMPVWITGPVGAAALRNLRNLVRWLPGVPRDRAQTVIILSPSADVPPELTNHCTVIEWPLPDRAEIAALLETVINALPEFETDPETGKPDPSKPLRANAAPNGTREAAIDAAIGLSGEEAQACYARSLITSKKIDPVLILNEKKRVIGREKVLEWYDPIPGGLDAVGGLENLKDWLIARKDAYSKEAREYGLPMPRGTFVFGVSGCGKSLLAKAVGAAWEVPVLRLDLNALKGKFVGESEGNLRKALRVIEAIGPSIVWIDEVEKALQGAVSGSADGGVSADALGTILTWMQERKGGAFVFATANNVEALPPEFMRKGRFDEMWFVDLPNETERCAVLRAALKANGRGSLKVNEAAIAEVTDGFTGAEIAAIVPDAMFAAFGDGRRELTTDDLLKVADTITPLSKTAKEKIANLREWASTRSRRATREEKATVGERVTQLDF